MPKYHTNAFVLQAIIYNVGNKVAIEEKEVAIEEKKVTIRQKEVAIGNQKVTKEAFEMLLKRKKYSEPTMRNLLDIYDGIGTNQIFGASEVAEILDFSYAGARKVLAKLVDMSILIAVKGKGKGKYRFLNNNEIQKITIGQNND